MILNLAWSNLWYNKKRTVILLILISLSFSSMLLFNGYIAYMKEGMELSYVSQTGHLKVSLPEYFRNDSSVILNANDIFKIENALDSNKAYIKSYSSSLSFSGIIGSNNKSSVFIGTGTDNAKQTGVEAGYPIIHENEVLVGGVLAESLGIKEDIEQFKKVDIDLMSNIEDIGMTFGSFEAVGIYNTGVNEIDSRLIIMDRSDSLSFFDLESGASYYSLILKDGSSLNNVKSVLIDKLGNEYEVKDWLELNPSYKQVCSMFDNIYFFLCVIMYILIFVSIAQALITEYTERLNEFGTLKAIGMKQSLIFLMVLLEIIFMCILSLGLGFCTSLLIKYLADLLNLKFIPPGYDVGYNLDFIYDYAQIIKLSFFVLLICLISSIFPIYKIKTSSANSLMHM